MVWTTILHVMLSAPPTMSVSNAVKLIKGATSRWIHQTFPDMVGFAWQSGYATLSLGRTQLKDTERYILRQRQHHADMTFEEELAIFLRRNAIKVDS